MSKRFSATVLIACALLVSTMTMWALGQRRRDLPKRTTTQVKQLPVPGDLVPTRSQELWVSIFPIGMQIFGLDRDVRDPNTIYAGTHRGLYKTSNGGFYWTPLFRCEPQFLCDTKGLSFAQSPSAPNVMYLGHSWLSAPRDRVRLWRSDNAGQTWQDISAGNIVKGTISQLVRGVRQICGRRRGSLS